MARTVPGTGASIEPIFDEVFGVRAVKVLNGGSGYDPADPPRLTITGCGTPTVAALLYPIIGSGGQIVHVRVLERGSGYDPLRLQIIPEQETPNVVNSFDFNRIWQRHPNSLTQGTFALSGTAKTDRLTIVSDNHPKPSQVYVNERQPGGSTDVVDRNFNQEFVFRGGKDVPNPGTREFQENKAVGILANGGLLHTADWGVAGNAFTNFPIDVIKYDYVKNTTAYDTINDSGVHYYHTSKTIDEFKIGKGVFEWGLLRVFIWNVKVEFDNVMLPVDQIDETLGAIEVGRIVDDIAGTGRGEIAKIVRNSLGVITRIYLRLLTGDSFANGDLCLGSNGFKFRVSADPITFTNGLFYIDFGTHANEFGAFTSGQYYLAPEDIKVHQNNLIIWNQSDSSNSQGNAPHPMQFSTTADGTLNGGTLYYTSTGSSGNVVADYENSLQPWFIMNGDETQKIYYYCANHRYMSGYAGDEGYIQLDTATQTGTAGVTPNTYYINGYYGSGATLDYSRYADGHSRILGMSFDGYPIYGPWGYNSSGAVARETSSFRLRTTAEIQGARPIVNTASTVTYAVTVANGEFAFDGSSPEFLNLYRGKTYIFNQDDSTNDDSNHVLFSTQTDGWHSSNPAVIGDTSVLYSGNGISYWIDGASVTYAQYLSGFNLATTREIRFTVPVDAPTVLYLFGYLRPGYGVRLVNDGYILGDLTSDYIYDSTVGTLDAYNGKFGVTPEYPNGTYAYFMTEDGSGNPVYPYAIGPQYYGAPIFEGDTVPAQPSTFPSLATGDVVLASNGSVAYVKMTRKGDNFFGPAKAKILGGEGSGAVGTPTVQTVTGLSLLNQGRSYASPPTLIFEGGGGQGAQGAAAIDTLGKVTGVNIVDPGEFYQEEPYVLISGGGGIGAKAEANISQGVITGINITDPGEGYTSVPNVIFTKLVNLKRKTRARQAFNSSAIYLTGLVKDVSANDTSIFVDSTDAYPGSGQIIVNKETIAYTSKTAGKFTGLTRGVNFNYDQRVVLDTIQNLPDGTSNYKFNVGDRVIRRVENANNKIAKVYDFDAATRELLVTFEVDELAFIDGGRPSTEDAIVQFDAGVAASSGAGILPHVVIDSVGNSIPTLTIPLGSLTDKDFEDDDENAGAGDGIPDLVNTSTDYASQINLDGGIFSSLYGIEETQGGTNTTLFQVGDSIKDADIPFKYATVVEAGGLADGVAHPSILNITLDVASGNAQNFQTNEVVTGAISGVRATVVSWNSTNGVLQVNNVIPFNTGNVNIGIAGLLYEFSQNSSIIDFIIANPGTNYTGVPTIAIENTGDIQATGTVVMTTAGDQVASITIGNGGYGIPQTVDGTYNLHPTVTFTNAGGDSTGANAAAQAVLGGEVLNGNGGASYRIKSIEYLTTVRS